LQRAPTWRTFRSMTVPESAGGTSSGLSRRAWLTTVAGAGLAVSLGGPLLASSPADADVLPIFMFCNKCASLMFVTTAPCPAGGNHYPQGWKFQLPFNGYHLQTQPNWRMCRYCMAVFFAGYDPSGRNERGGICAGSGGAHLLFGGHNFLLPHGVGEPPWHQANWRFCGKTQYGCFSLFFDGYDGLNGRPYFKGVCPAGPGGHVAIGWNFAIPVNSYQ
jgi:hypothetical protein